MGGKEAMSELGREEYPMGAKKWIFRTLEETIFLPVKVQFLVSKSKKWRICYEKLVPVE